MISASVSKLNNVFFICFDPEKIVLGDEKNNFRGDLTDMSAEKEALAVIQYLSLLVFNLF